MPAASKNKLPPTLFVTAEIKIKWKMSVYKITDAFQDFFTLFPGWCWGTRNFPSNLSFEKLSLIDTLIGSLGIKHRERPEQAASELTCHYK